MKERRFANHTVIHWKGLNISEAPERSHHGENSRLTKSKENDGILMCVFFGDVKNDARVS